MNARRSALGWLGLIRFSLFLGGESCCCGCQLIYSRGDKADLPQRAGGGFVGQFTPLRKTTFVFSAGNPNKPAWSGVKSLPKLVDVGFLSLCCHQVPYIFKEIKVTF